MKNFKLLVILLSGMPTIFAQNAETDATEIAMLLNIPKINEPYKRVQEAELKNYPETKYSPDAIASVILSNKNESITGELVASATAGLYSINYNGIITQTAESVSLLSFYVQYTDPDVGGVVTVPYTDIENYNSILGGEAGSGNISGNLLVYAAEATPISYIIKYSSNPTPAEEAGNAMQYSLRIVVEKL